jgi:hypothetical protein
MMTGAWFCENFIDDLARFSLVSGQESFVLCFSREVSPAIAATPFPIHQ